MLLALLERITDAYFAFTPRRKPRLEQAQATRLIAHRGAHDNDKGLIENTLVAFNLAEQAGCWGIEMDVHATADKILVVNHDPTLNRIWEHDVAIADLNFAQLRELVPGVPSLAEVVAQFGRRMHLFIELKAPFRDEDALVQVLSGLTAGEDYHLLSLDASIFRALSQCSKCSLLLVAEHNNVREFCNLSLKEQYGGVLGHYFLLSTKLVKLLKTARQNAGVGFIDTQYGLYRELNRDMNWIFTNRVDAMSTYLHTLLK